MSEVDQLYFHYMALPTAARRLFRFGMRAAIWPIVVRQFFSDMWRHKNPLFAFVRAVREYDEYRAFMKKLKELGD